MRQTWVVPRKEAFRPIGDEGLFVLSVNRRAYTQTPAPGNALWLSVNQLLRRQTRQGKL